MQSICKASFFSVLSVISVAKRVFFSCDLYRIAYGKFVISLLLPETLCWGFLLLGLVSKWFIEEKSHDNTLSSDKTDLKYDERNNILAQSPLQNNESL